MIAGFKIHHVQCEEPLYERHRTHGSCDYFPFLAPLKQLQLHYNYKPTHALRIYVLQSTLLYS